MANSNDVLPVYIGDDRTDEDAFKVNLSTLFFKVLVKTLCLLLCGKNIFCISCLWECVCVPSVWLRWWMEWNMGAAFWSPLRQKAQVQLTPSVILLRYRILPWLFFHPSSYRKCCTYWHQFLLFLVIEPLLAPESQSWKYLHQLFPHVL
jgi:hypothetical protein